MYFLDGRASVARNLFGHAKGWGFYPAALFPPGPLGEPTEANLIQHLRNSRNANLTEIAFRVKYHIGVEYVRRVEQGASILVALCEASSGLFDLLDVLRNMYQISPEGHAFLDALYTAYLNRYRAKNPWTRKREESVVATV